MDWRNYAACREENPDLFFPLGDTGAALLQVEEAKGFCRRRCPVINQCLVWALESGEEYGVWGGQSESQLRTIRRDRAIRRDAP